MKITHFTNRLFSGINSIYHLTKYAAITYIERIYLFLIGVQITGGKFQGWCSFYYKNGSKIKIGKNAKFNFSHWSNHIGLNHRCIISTITKDAQLTIGNNLGMSSSTITCFKRIDIGNNVRIGANCVIADGDFHLDDPRVGVPKPITIQDNVWLGYGVIVMKGVTIGKNSIIGMNSVVSKDIPANSVAAGSPAKVIKTLENN